MRACAARSRRRPGNVSASGRQNRGNGRMIDLYTWPTPNGRKAAIMLEEAALPYRVVKIDITNGDQFRPEYLAINPNGKIPTIIDHEGPDGGDLAIFES